MPGNVDEKLWNKAKASFKKQHKKDPKSSSDFAIVSSIYKKMGGKFGKEMIDLAESFIGLLQEKIDKDCLKKGMKIEKKEHPQLDDKAVKQLVMDHLKDNPDYYKKENTEDNKMNYLEDLKNMKEAKIKVGDKVHCPSGFCKVTKVKGKKITVLSKSDGEFEYDSKDVSTESFTDVLKNMSEAKDIPKGPYNTADEFLNDWANASELQEIAKKHFNSAEFEILKKVKSQGIVTKFNSNEANKVISNFFKNYLNKKYIK